MILLLQVEKFHITLLDQEFHFDPNDMKNNSIIIPLVVHEETILGRVKYKGYDEWTSVITSNPKVIQSIPNKN